MSDKKSITAPLVRQRLDEKFATKIEMPVTVVCDQAESYILELVHLAVHYELGLINSNISILHSASASKSNLAYGDRFYELRLTEHSVKTQVLNVTLQCTDPESSNLVRKSAKSKIDSLGRYTEVRLVIERDFSAHQESIIYVICIVLETGYRWLTEYVRHSLDKVRSEAAEATYSHLRQLFPKEIVDQIWLYAIFEEKGINIPDAIAHEALIKRASERKSLKSGSPLEIVADFSTRLVNFDDTFSNIAISENRVIEGNLLGARYGGSGIELSEESIYHGTQFVIQPLVREGRTLLTAVYLPEVRSKVEPVLNKERKKIDEILNRTTKTLIQQIKEQGALPGLKPKHFEYLGAFVRGILDLPR